MRLYGIAIIISITLIFNHRVHKSVHHEITWSTIRCRRPWVHGRRRPVKRNKWVVRGGEMRRCRKICWTMWGWVHEIVAKFRSQPLCPAVNFLVNFAIHGFELSVFPVDSVSTKALVIGGIIRVRVRITSTVAARMGLTIMALGFHRYLLE